MGQIIAGGGALRIDYAGNLLRLAGDMDAALIPAWPPRWTAPPMSPQISISIWQAWTSVTSRACGPWSCSATPATKTPTWRGRRVILHQPPAELKYLLQILGWDSTPGLVIDNTSGRPS